MSKPNSRHGSRPRTRAGDQHPQQVQIRPLPSYITGRTRILYIRAICDLLASAGLLPGELAPLAALAQQGVFPVTREQAVCIVTLVLHYLWREWQWAANRERHNLRRFRAGAERLYKILEQHEATCTARGTDARTAMA